MSTLDSWLKGCTDAVFHQEIGSTSVAINNSFLVHTLIASHPPLEEGGHPQGCGWPAGKSCPWPGSGRPAGTGAWWSRSPPDPSAWPELLPTSWSTWWPLCGNLPRLQGQRGQRQDPAACSPQLLPELSSRRLWWGPLLGVWWRRPGLKATGSWWRWCLQPHLYHPPNEGSGIVSNKLCMFGLTIQRFADGDIYHVFSTGQNFGSILLQKKKNENSRRSEESDSLWCFFFTGQCSFENGVSLALSTLSSTKPYPH